MKPFPRRRACERARARAGFLKPAFRRAGERLREGFLAVLISRNFDADPS
jgi:hypothetical protein